MLGYRALVFFSLFFAAISAKAYVAKDLDEKSFKFETCPRIASITPSVSETVFLLGKTDKLLGVSRYCNYPETLKDKPSFGGFVDPNYEKILKFKPELIILPKTSDSTVRDKLARLEIPVFLIHADGIDNIVKNTLMIGQVLDKNFEAQLLAQKVSEAIKPNLNVSKRPKAMLLFGKLAAGKGSYVGELLERVGFENLAAKSGTPWPVLSKEFLLLNQPEVLILEVKENENFQKMCEKLYADPLWSKTPAVKNKKIYEINSELIIVPAPRIIKARERLDQIFLDSIKQ